MRKSVVAFIGLSTLAFSSVAHAYSFWDGVADVLTGGAYSATKATVTATENLVRDAKALQGDIQSLMARIQRLGQHSKDAIDSAAKNVEHIAKDRIEAIEAIQAPIDRDAVRRIRAIDQEVATYKQAVAKLTPATSPAEAERIRADMKQAGQRMLDRLAKEDAGLFPLIPSAGAGQRVSCDWAHSFANPQAAVTGAASATTRMKDLERAVAGDLNKSLKDSVKLANAELASGLGASKTAAMTGLQASQAGLNFGLNELQKDMASLTMALINPMMLVQHPLAPIRDAVAKVDRSVDAFDSQIVTASKKLTDDVLNRTQAALRRSDQARASLLDNDRRSEQAFMAAARAMACGDPASIAAVGGSAGSPPPTTTPPATTVQPPATTLSQCTCTCAGTSAGAGAARSAVGADRVKTSTDQLASSQNAARAALQQLQNAAAAKRAESDKQLEQAFRNKTPKEIADARAQILQALRSKLSAQPNMLAAAEAAMEREIAERSRGAATGSAAGKK
jgi:hypothetical protein